MGKARAKRGNTRGPLPVRVKLISSEEGTEAWGQIARRLLELNKTEVTEELLREESVQQQRVDPRRIDGALTRRSFSPGRSPGLVETTFSASAVASPVECRVQYDICADVEVSKGRPRLPNGDPGYPGGVYIGLESIEVVSMGLYEEDGDEPWGLWPGEEIDPAVRQLDDHPVEARPHQTAV